MTKVTERIAAGDYSSLSDDSPISLRPWAKGRGTRSAASPRPPASWRKKVKQCRSTGSAVSSGHIAHELDSPLARIKLGLAVLDSRVDEKDQQRVHEISDEVEQLSPAGRGFAELPCVPRPFRSPAREAVSLAPLLQCVTRREARDRDVRLSVDEGLKVWADASCASAGRSPTWCATPCVMPGVRPHRHCRKGPQGDRVWWKSATAAPAVPPRKWSNITEPFFRGEQAKKYPGGSGLGMSIVKHCVEACRGELH